MIAIDEAGLIRFDADINFAAIDEKARNVLGEALRHSILSITMDTRPPQDDDADGDAPPQVVNG